MGLHKTVGQAIGEAAGDSELGKEIDLLAERRNACPHPQDWIFTRKDGYKECELCGKITVEKE